MIAKFIFLGLFGVMFGVFVTCVIGSMSDPDIKHFGFWVFAILFMSVLGASGMIWLGELV